MPHDQKIRVLFVCMGNICRSPTAEAVFRRAVAEAGLGDLIECDSAGTHGYHIDEPPDRRAQQAAIKRGYDMCNLRGRKISARDFSEFDHILAMDRQNLALLGRECPRAYAHKLALFCDFQEDCTGREVPDPYYYGGTQGFEQVLDLIETASRGLIAHLRPST